MVVTEATTGKWSYCHFPRWFPLLLQGKESKPLWEGLQVPCLLSAAASCPLCSDPHGCWSYCLLPSEGGLHFTLPSETPVLRGTSGLILTFLGKKQANILNAHNLYDLDEPQFPSLILRNTLFEEPILESFFVTLCVLIGLRFPPNFFPASHGTMGGSWTGLGGTRSDPSWLGSQYVGQCGAPFCSVPDNLTVLFLLLCWTLSVFFLRLSPWAVFSVWAH